MNLGVIFVCLTYCMLTVGTLVDALVGRGPPDNVKTWLIFIGYVAVMLYSKVSREYDNV